MSSVGVMASAVVTAAFGTEQTLVIAGVPSLQVTNYEFGVRVQFGRAGRVTKIRYRRGASASNVLRLRAWNDSTQAKVFDEPEASAGLGTTGQYTITLPTPLAVAAGSIYIFSIGTAGDVMYASTAATVTNTTDMTFLEMRIHAGAADVYPEQPVPTLTFFVEPTYEPAS